MTDRHYVRNMLLVALIAMSLGGLLLHLRIHPLEKNLSNFVPFVSGILGAVVVPLLFCWKRTLSYGYVLNGMSVVVGTVAMSHFSIANWPAPTTLGAILMKTTLPDILLLWGKFCVGKSLFDLEIYGYDPKKQRGGNTYRYPNLGWWVVHLFAISLVYSLGNVLWR